MIHLPTNTKVSLSDAHVRYHLPITDAVKKQLAQRRRLFFKVCLRCGLKNPISASRCRKCRSEDLRLKNRALGAKK